MAAALLDPTALAASAAANTIATGDRLFDLQLAFNLFPAAYAHASWIPQMGADDGEALPSPAFEAPFWTRSLSALLLRAWRLDGQFDCDFFDPAKRLALIDAPDALRIGGLAGAVLMRERLRHIVDRVEVEALRQGIGLEAQRFALKWHDAPADLALYVRTWTLPFDDPLPDARTWASHSASLIVAAIPPTAAGVLGRLQLRFPRSGSQPPAPRLRLPEPQRASLAALLIRIIRADAGPWAWLFEPAAMGGRSC